METITKNILVLCLCLSLGAKAQATHWSINEYGFQYDMSACLTVEVNGKSVADMSDYEIAAFCSTECRGVASVQTITKDGQQTQYAYMRIRSNQQEGETITFKVYKKSTGKEFDADDVTVAFKSQTITGLPSTPLSIPVTTVQLGDVNGDGSVDVQDVVLTVNYVIGRNPENFIRNAADMNKDGDVDVQDVVLLVNKVIGKS